MNPSLIKPCRSFLRIVKQDLPILSTEEQFQYHEPQYAGAYWYGQQILENYPGKGLPECYEYQLFVREWFGEHPCLYKCCVHMLEAFESLYREISTHD